MGTGNLKSTAPIAQWLDELLMKLPERVHKDLFGVLLASLVLLGGLSAARKPSMKTWGEAVNGLQMTI
jgi:hypothetical protein